MQSNDNNLKEILTDNFENFFGDFHYQSNQLKNLFFQNFNEGKKVVVLNNSLSENALMVEIQLAIHIPQVEQKLSELGLRNTSSSQMSFTYRQYLSDLNGQLPKRMFANNEDELKALMKQYEASMIQFGFHRLDELSDPKVLINALDDAFNAMESSNNLLLMAYRALILKQILHSKLSEADFFSYYEILQERKIPEYQLSHFIDNRSQFI